MRKRKLIACRRSAIRHFRAKLRKNFVDDQAARPSSWKTPRIARRMEW
jgi:hypothetical protein